MQLMSHFAPQILKYRASSNDPMFGEIVPPERLRNFTADLSSLGALLKPNQVVANFARRELARGKCQTPSYTPYIFVDMSASPWPFPSVEHASDAVKRMPKKQASKPGDPPPPPFHAWELYRLRFIATADLCADWIPLGGLADHLNNLSIMLHLATTESISVALAYDSILSAHLEELARSC